MTPKETIFSVLERRNNSKIPLAAYSFLFPRGEAEREIREKGCGIFQFERVYVSEMKNVEICVKEGFESGQKFTFRRLSTPVGKVEEKILVDPGYDSQWVKEFLIKEPEDYKVFEYIVGNTIYYPNYEFFQRVEKDLGEDGVLFANVDRSPFQKLLLELAGPERLLVDIYEREELVESLMGALTRKQEEIYRIVINSPASVVHNWDNVTEDLTSPRLFEKYCVPFYQKFGRLLRERGKLFVVHMDGKLKHLKDLIAQAPIDVIESFTLPDAGGNLTIKEAQEAWREKTIIANLPAYLSLEKEEFIRGYFANLMSQVDKKRFMVCVSEDLPRDLWQRTLKIVADTLDKS